jgi:alanyl-tRNA synthetase
MGCRDPLMWRLVPVLVQQMGAAYPELLRAQPLVTETLRHEEGSFKQMLERGLAILGAQTGDFGDRNGPGLDAAQKMLSGDIAFMLYDTHGFPLDMTQDILRRHGMGVDVAGCAR